MGMTWRRRALVCGVLALGLSTGACSGGEGPSESASLADEPAQQATEQPSSADDDVPEDDDVSVEFFSRFGAWIESVTTVHIAMTTEQSGAVLMSTEGQIDYSTDPASQAQVITGMAEEPVEVRVVEGVVYANLGSQTGGNWVVIGPENAGYAGLVNSDPLAQMRLFEDSATGVELLGAEDLDGTMADHYVVTVDTASIPNDSAEELPPSLDYELWLDGEGRLLQMVFEMDTPSGVITATATMSEFGAASTIEAPPADEVSQG